MLEPTYDISASYEENYHQGPRFLSEPPAFKRQVADDGDAFLGLSVL